MPGLELPIELGAEFIHGRAEVTRRYLKSAGLACERGGREQEMLIERGRWRKVDAFAEARRATRDAASLEKKDVSFEQFLAGKPLPATTARLARMMVEGFDAADPRLVSARSIVEEWGAGGELGDSQPRPRRGYGALLGHIADSVVRRGVRLKLNARVTQIVRGRGGVRVDVDFAGRALRATARRAVVTLPLGVLQSGPVRFPEKRPALLQLASGPVVKAALRFRRPFWSSRHPGIDFFHAPQAAFPTFWTRGSALIAWAGGPKAARLAGKDALGQALESLERMFPGARRELDAAWVHDWRADPLARGAYSYLKVGGEGARQALAQPIADTLYFAGEATDAEEAGTVAGALRSGLRAAKEILSV